MNADRLAQSLWPQGSGPACSQAYVLLDGAKDPCIAPLVRSSGLPYCCLYAGSLSQDLLSAAPYLVQIAPEAKFFKAFVPQAWGQAWGVFAVASPDVSLQVLRRHFRSLLLVRNEQGESLAFRFYDPRVLRTYVPTCQFDEHARLMGPVQALAAESWDGLDVDWFVRADCHIAQGGQRLDDVLAVRPEQMNALHTGWLAWRLHRWLAQRYKQRPAAGMPPPLPELSSLIARAQAAGVSQLANIAIHVIGASTLGFSEEMKTLMVTFPDLSGDHAIRLWLHRRQATQKAAL
jgi:uncharacterized protein DUF4123